MLPRGLNLQPRRRCGSSSGRVSTTWTRVLLGELPRRRGTRNARLAS